MPARRKKCSDCLKLKALSSYYNEKSYACKSCHQAEMALHRLNHLEYYRARDRHRKSPHLYPKPEKQICRTRRARKSVRTP